MVVLSVRNEEDCRDGVTMTTTCHIIDVHQLASVVKNRLENVLILDSRCFIEYNISHVATAVNVCCSKIVKRRLQQDKLSVKELLTHTCHCDVDDTYDVVVYDQCSKDWTSLPSESFTTILLSKLQRTFHSVNLLSGGFSEFQHLYPELCGDKVRKLPPLSSLSQPCLPIADQGPTRILPFLYLGSQFDALNKDLLKDHNITYELNVSMSCPKPDFLADAHFMRISVNDSYSEKLLPHFPEAFRFLDKVRESSCSVLVHCLAGISRSPTVAIAYVMRHLRLTSDDGYRYVKSKRPTISPNFNFLGQLLEFEKQLRREKILDGKPDECTTPPLGSKKRLCKTDMRKAPKLTLSINTELSFSSAKPGDQSPTTALAKLSFSGPPTPEVCAPPPGLHHSRSYESMVDQIATSKDFCTGSVTKILSPVKEIKCESLISEISYGNGGGTKSRSREMSQWKLASSRSTIRSEVSGYSFSQVFQKDSQTISRSETVERESELKTYSQIKHLKKEFKFPTAFDSPWGTKEPYRSEKSPARTTLSRYPDSHCSSRSSEATPLPVCHSTQSNLCSRSDSAATSGFGSESSDFLEEAGKISKVEFDVEELEDDVILKSADVASKRSGTRFSFTLPEVYVSQGLQSPLSPSESHLLEDNISNTACVLQKSASTSPSASDHHSLGDSDSQLDSGVSSSPWPWSRKRTAPFDEVSSQEGHSDSQQRFVKQQQYDPPRDNSRTARTYNDLDLSSGDSGLYRVQSCPGMTGSLEEKSFLVGGAPHWTRRKASSGDGDGQPHRHSTGDADRLFVRDAFSSGSCPDVLQIGGAGSDTQSTPSSPHHRHFRRNVRLIRVS